MDFLWWVTPYVGLVEHHLAKVNVEGSISFASRLENNHPHKAPAAVPRPIISGNGFTP